MEASKQKILDRVIKILALAADSSFEGEAANARRMAAELMERHGVRLPVEGKPARDGIATWRHPPQMRKWLWERMIAEALAELFGCGFLVSGDAETGEGYNYFLFVGFRSDLEALQYVFGEIHRQRIKAWVDFRGNKGDDSFGKFCFSFARGLGDKVERIVTSAQINQAERMVLAYTKKHPVSGRFEPIRGRGSSAAGHAAGGGASLHRGTVGGSTPQARIGR